MPPRSPSQADIPTERVQAIAAAAADKAVAAAGEASGTRDAGVPWRSVVAVGIGLLASFGATAAGWAHARLLDQGDRLTRIEAQLAAHEKAEEATSVRYAADMAEIKGGMKDLQSKLDTLLMRGPR